MLDFISLYLFLIRQCRDLGKIRELLLVVNDDLGGEVGEEKVPHGKISLAPMTVPTRFDRSWIKPPV